MSIWNLTFKVTIKFHLILFLWAKVFSSHTLTCSACMCVSAQQSRPVHLYNQFKAFHFLSVYLCQAWHFRRSGLLTLPSVPAGRNCGRSFLAWEWRSIDEWSCHLLLEVGGKGTSDSLIYQLFWDIYLLNPYSEGGGGGGSGCSIYGLDFYWMHCLCGTVVT